LFALFDSFFFQPQAQAHPIAVELKEELLAQLASMGFKKEAATRALQDHRCYRCHAKCLNKCLKKLTTTSFNSGTI
jgi:hypothetical protein